MIKKIIRFLFRKEEPLYCEKCGACGEEGCCSPLSCAYEHLVKHPRGLYCKGYYKDLKFSYELAQALYNKYQDEEIFDRLWDEIYNRK